jgi:hypothetical protein
VLEILTSSLEMKKMKMMVSKKMCKTNRKREREKERERETERERQREGFLKRKQTDEEKNL